MQSDLRNTQTIIRKVLITWLLAGALFIPWPSDAAQPITVGIYNFEPIVFIDNLGHARGFFIDILNHIAVQEGWEIKTVPGSWDECLTRLKNNEIDLLGSIAYSEERARKLDFTREHIFLDWGLVYTKKGAAIETVFDLEGKKIAALRGSIYTTGFKKTLDQFGITCHILEFSEYTEVFRAIEAGVADAGINAQVYGMKLEGDYEIERTQIFFSPVKIRIAVPKGDHRGILAKLDQHLLTLKADGASIYYELFDRWMGLYGIYGKREIPRWLPWMFTLLCATLCLLACFSIVLKKKVTEKTAALSVKNKELQKEIAERRQSEQALKERGEQLRQAQKMEALATLAGGIAHDFNNILSSINGYAEIALYDELPEDSPARFSIEQVLKAGDRARNLVKQFLTFSRQGEHEKKPIKIDPLIKETVKLLRASIPSNIDIHLSIQPDLNMVLADPIQIHQVLMNLCANSEYAMRATGGAMEISLTEIKSAPTRPHAFKGLKASRLLQLSVSDTGRGMDSQTLDRAFDPFFTTKPKSEGTGLGLPVVHGIIKDHGGDIHINSELNTGTRVDIWLPIADVDKPPPVKIHKSLPTGHERILVVDDEKSVLKYMGMMLGKLGYQVTGKTSSIEALDRFTRTPEDFDIVITDQTMPEMTGDVLTSKIKQIRSDIPIILCTGFSYQVDRDKARDQGIQGFLFKPVSRMKMAQAIRRVLDNVPPGTATREDAR